MGKQNGKNGCSACGSLNCYRQGGEYPGFCLTTSTTPEESEEIKELYRSDPQVSKMALAAADIEGTYYGKLTRVEEIVAYASRIGAKKIGIATCIGLMNETKTFVRFLDAKGLESYSVICKVGSVDKTEIGIPEEKKVQQGSHEAICNPVLQAKFLNREKTDLNVIVGLCVGHDSLFIKYSDAPVTCLIVKDRVLGHNPAAALYTSQFYYKRLFSDERL
jgi:uncharacterized metal-binding protein